MPELTRVPRHLQLSAEVLEEAVSGRAEGPVEQQLRDGLQDKMALQDLDQQEVRAEQVAIWEPSESHRPGIRWGLAVGAGRAGDLRLEIREERVVFPRPQQPRGQPEVLVRVFARAAAAVLVETSQPLEATAELEPPVL